MPFYDYKPEDKSCDFCKDGFEIFQKMLEDSLKACPECFNPCYKVFSSFSVTGSQKNILSPKNLEKHGFTQFTKKGKGYYEKTAGKGPQGIAGPSS